MPTKKRTIPHRSPRKHYAADACIIWCFDNRFYKAFEKLVKKLRIKTFDPIFLAGGAKTLADPEEEYDRTFLLRQIKKSVKLHGPKRVIFMLHSDCGAFGGLTAFGNDPEKERWHMTQLLKNAKSVIAMNLPEEVAVHTFFVDFEKIEEV